MTPIKKKNTKISTTTTTTNMMFFREKFLEKYSQLLSKNLQPNFHRIWPKTSDFT